MGKTMKWRFKSERDFDVRKAEAASIKQRYPERIPVVVENAKPGILPDLDKRKFLVPYDLTVAQFYYIIRKRITLRPDMALFCFVNDTVPAASLLMGELYEAHQDEDLFMYFAYTDHDPFGSKD